MNKFYVLSDKANENYVAFMSGRVVFVGHFEDAARISDGINARGLRDYLECAEGMVLNYREYKIDES